MKPIKLEIAGLQSFIEKQTIDFSAAENGIFGIFGKTGSGKSTILDGITLALYGYVSRISKNAEFINSKCKSAEVTLQFACDGKVYEVTRTFKLKKNNKDVDSYAELKSLSNNESVIIAEGTFQTDKKIIEIVGLTPSEFCQVIALPQGKFAEFLQAKPADRTMLISNIFGITEYAEKLYNNAKDNLNKYEKELSILEAEKDGVGAVSTTEIKNKEDVFNLQEAELKELSTTINNLNTEYMRLVENASLKKDQIKLKEELELLYKKSGDIKADKERLIKYENAKKMDIYFSTKEKLVRQLTELNEEVSRLRNQKQEQEMFFRDYEEQFKKFEAVQKNALIELDAKRAMIVGLEEDKLLIESLTNEKERLKNDLQEKKERYKEVEENTKSIDEKIDFLSKEILGLFAEKESYEKEKNSLGIVAENKSIESEIILIEQFEKQIERLIENYKQELDDQKNEYTTVYKKEREQARKIEETNVALDKIMGKSGKAITERFRDVLNKLSGMDNVQDKYEFLDVIIEKTKSENLKYTTKIKEIEKQSDEINTILQEKIQLASRLENGLKNAQIKREEFLGENVISLLVQNIETGDSCPICKNRVSVKQTIPTSDLSGLDAEIATIRSNLSLVQKDKERTLANLAANNAAINFLKSQINLNLTKINNYKETQDKLYMAYVDKNNKQAENFKSMHEATYAASIALEKLLVQKDKLIDSSLSVIEQRVELGVRIQTTNEYIEKLTDILYSLEKSRAEREFAIYNAQNESGLDYRTASKQLNKIIEKIETIQENIKEKENHKQNFINEKFELTKLTGLLTGEISAAEIKIENLNNTISEKQSKFTELGFSISDENPMEQIKSKQAELASKANEFKENYDRKLDQKLKSEKEYNLKLAIMQEKNEDLRETEATLSNLARTYGFDSEDDAKSYLVDKLVIEELKILVEDFEKRVSIVNVQLSSINEKIGEKDIDTDFVDSIKNELEQLKLKLSEKQVYFGVIQAELSEMKNKKSKLDKIDERLPEIRKKYDLAKELYSLLRGKSLAEFMANEYVDMIIGFANEKLRILDGGRYKIFYENKEFYVEDNLNDGSPRIVSTLSGGETFLVSLSLALAISDVIAMQSDKKIEFFFLDEGFGTLDSELCQTVVEALFKLKSANLNIGLISHVQELQTAMQFKFLVTKASENSGSKVQLVTSL